MVMLDATPDYISSKVRLLQSVLGVQAAPSLAEKEGSKYPHCLHIQVFSLFYYGLGARLFKFKSATDCS